MAIIAEIECTGSGDFISTGNSRKILSALYSKLSTLSAEEKISSASSSLAQLFELLTKASTDGVIVDAEAITETTFGVIVSSRVALQDADSPPDLHEAATEYAKKLVISAEMYLSVLEELKSSKKTEEATLTELYQTRAQDFLENLYTFLAALQLATNSAASTSEFTQIAAAVEDFEKEYRGTMTSPADAMSELAYASKQLIIHLVKSASMQDFARMIVAFLGKARKLAFSLPRISHIPIQDAVKKFYVLATVLWQQEKPILLRKPLVKLLEVLQSCFQEYSSTQEEAAEELFCSGCKDVVDKKSEFVEALGKTWHPQHFVCNVCSAPLRGDYFDVEGEPFCEADYLKTFGRMTCAHCHGVIYGDHLKAIDHYWHLDHLLCNGCNVDLQNVSFF
eukprot:TRINITY_DN2423_c0_g1_i1.p1 TRINITY_DN2423_c0_g1~~TRINITY_DN2423_c0_g1_i1.p1  ORF type:complete len:433 (+),score=73.51 TRINITY_DN2423_c0_g1_i1:120-1301(+)